MTDKSAEQIFAEFGQMFSRAFEPGQEPVLEVPDPNLDFAEFSEEQTGDLAVLEEVGIRILEGEVSTEDYKTVRMIAQKYYPNQVFNFSPRLMGREASLESLEGLKRFAGTGIAVAVIMALLSLIDHLFGGDDGKSGGTGAATSKRLEEATKRYEAAAEKLAKAQDSLRDIGTAVDKLTDENVKELANLSNAAEEARKTKVYKAIAEVVKRQAPNLSDKDLDNSVHLIVKIAQKYLSLMGGEANYAKLKPHFSQGLDIYKTLNSEIFANGANSWCRMRFLSASGFEPSIELDTASKTLKQYYANFSEYRHDIDELVNAVSSGQKFDLNAFNAKYSVILQSYGQNAVDVSLGNSGGEVKVPLTKAEARELNDKMKAHFELIDPQQIIAKNVLSKLIGADRRAVTEELQRLDEMSDQAEDLKSWIEKSDNGDGGLVQLSKTIDILKNKTTSDSKPSMEEYLDSPFASLNFASGIIRIMTEITGNLVTLAGNFSRGMKRVSVGYSQLAKTYEEIAVLTESLDKVERGASTENYQEDPPNFDPTTDIDDIILGGSNNEDGLHMREVRIPKNVILPHGIDVNALRDLVEADPSNWSLEDLSDYSSSVQESLCQLHNDLDVIEEVRDHIARTGMISSGQVLELEKIHPGLITNQTPIGRFTSFESVNYARPSLEAASNLAGGAKVVAGVAAIAILAKILQWCFKRFQASRDVTKSIKGNVEVISKLNDQIISSVTGSNSRVEALSPDLQGKLLTDVKKHFSDTLEGVNSWYDVKDTEKSLMNIRLEVFVKEHEKSYSELTDSLVRGGDGYKLLQALTAAAEKGAATLDKAVDNVAQQIDHLADGQSGNTEYKFTGLDLGLDGFTIKDLKLDAATGNPGKAEMITAYVAAKKDAKLGKDKLRTVEVDKLNARLTEMATKIKEVNGRVESEFKKIQSRLDKLEKANAAASEADSSDGSAKASRDAIKSYIDSIHAEFDAYSKIIGAHKAILTVLDAEVKAYGNTLKKWKGYVDWHNKKVSSVAKETSQPTT